MEAEKSYFPGQEKDEKITLLIRKHWFNYIIFFVVGILGIMPIIGITVFLLFSSIIISDQIYSTLIVLGSIYLLFLLSVLMIGFIDYYLDVYIVTDRRIVDINQLGLFRRSISELHLKQVQDVSAHVNGFSQTMLHFGNVFIQTAGETPNFTFESIPHPYTVAKQIIDLHERQLGRKPRKPSSGSITPLSKAPENPSQGTSFEKNFGYQKKVENIFVAGTQQESGKLTEGKETELQ